MFKNALKATLVAQSLFLSTSVFAATFNFTGINADEVDVRNQLSLNVTQLGNSVDFNFINAAGGAQTFVGAIYFDFLGSNPFSTLTQTASTGTVSFTGVTPSDQNLPEGNNIGFSTNAYGDRIGGATNGISVGESLVLTALLSSPADINALLQSGGLRVGLHMQGYATGGSDSYVTTPNGPSEVPLPAAAWLFGSALIGFAGFKRKSI